MTSRYTSNLATDPAGVSRAVRKGLDCDLCGTKRAKTGGLRRQWLLARLMRPMYLAGMVGATACPADDTPELRVEILSVTFEVEPDAPDAVVDLDVSVDLHATVEPATVRVTELSATTLPKGSGARDLTFEPRLFGPQGENATVPVGADETLVVRVIAGSTTNAELADLCDRSVEVYVALETADRTAEDTFDITIRCP